MRALRGIVSRSSHLITKRENEQNTSWCHPKSVIRHNFVCRNTLQGLFEFSQASLVGTHSSGAPININVNEPVTS